MHAAFEIPDSPLLGPDAWSAHLDVEADGKSKARTFHSDIIRSLGDDDRRGNVEWRWHCSRLQHGTRQRADPEVRVPEA